MSTKASTPKKKTARKSPSARKICRPIIKVPGINQRTGHLLKGWHYENGKPVKVKAPAKKKSAAKSTAKKKATAKKKIRKHQGINQTTGRLKKGWKYDGKGGIVKAAAKKK